MRHITRQVQEKRDEKERKFERINGYESIGGWAAILYFRPNLKVGDLWTQQTTSFMTSFSIPV